MPVDRTPLPAQESRAERRRPNVVLVFMDDMTHWAIGRLGNRQVQTPNLDRLVDRGTAFTHALNQGAWTGAVCVPARAMMLTGRSLFHARSAIDGGPAEQAPMLGQVLGSAGYRTYFTGKWHNSAEALNRGYQTVGPHGGGMLRPIPLADGSEDAGRPIPGNHWDPADPAGAGHWLRVGDKVVHSSERWIDCALDFLNGADLAASPFFLHVALHAPHDPRQSPRRWLDRYPPDAIELPPNLLPEHPFDQGDRLERDEMLAPFPRTAEAVRLHRSEYFAIVSHADEQIGRLLDAIDQRGLAEQTIVVFSGDHGLALGEHGLMGKQNLYDHSVRVPLVFAGPGVGRGERVNALVHQASIFPTLCDLLEIDPPPGHEFPSLAPYFSGGARDGADMLFCAYRDLQRLVRTKRWALIAYRVPRRVQLFDMATDPWQMRDLAGSAEHAAVVGDLLAHLRHFQAQLDDPNGSWTSDIDSTWASAGDGIEPARWLMSESGKS